MEILFRHDINKNYMIIKVNENYVKTYKTKMLIRNLIPRLLLVSHKFFNGEEYLYYDISSKQSIKVLFEKQPIGQEDLIAIVMALKECIGKLNSFLLDFNNVLLKPEMIFRDYNKFEYFFCYFPYNNGDFQSSFEEFINYVVDRIDHNDSEAVEIAYNLNRIATRSTFIFEDIFNAICLKKEETEEEEVISLVEEKPQETEIVKKFPKEIMLLLVPGVGIWGYILYKYFEIRSVEIGVVVLFIILGVSGYLFYEKRKPKKLKNENLVKKEETLPVIEDMQTTLLDEAYIQKKMLKSLDNTNPDFLLENLPKIIGKMEGRAEWIINEPQISRMHACITEENNIYYIEDLNSTNGTFLDGKIIAPYSREILQPGALIQFAKITYKFV